MGLSANSAARLRLYSAVSYGVLGLVILLTRLRLVLARASRLLSFLMLEHLDELVSVVFFDVNFCLFLCAGIDVIAPPTRLPNLVPTYISMTIVYALPNRFA